MASSRSLGRLQRFCVAADGVVTSLDRAHHGLVDAVDDTHHPLRHLNPSPRADARTCARLVSSTVGRPGSSVSTLSSAAQKCATLPSVTGWHEVTTSERQMTYRPVARPSAYDVDDLDLGLWRIPRRTRGRPGSQRRPKLVTLLTLPSTTSPFLSFSGFLLPWVVMQMLDRQADALALLVDAEHHALNFVTLVQLGAGWVSFLVQLMSLTCSRPSTPSSSSMKAP